MTDYAGAMEALCAECEERGWAPLLFVRRKRDSKRKWVAHRWELIVAELSLDTESGRVAFDAIPELCASSSIESEGGPERLAGFLMHAIKEYTDPE